MGIVIYRGAEYDLRDYLEENSHPGGIESIIAHLGMDVTVQFYDLGYY